MTTETLIKTRSSLALPPELPRLENLIIRSRVSTFLLFLLLLLLAGCLITARGDSDLRHYEIYTARYTFQFFNVNSYRILDLMN